MVNRKERLTKIAKNSQRRFFIIFGISYEIHSVNKKMQHGMVFASV